MSNDPVHYDAAFGVPYKRRAFEDSNQCQAASRAASRLAILNNLYLEQDDDIYILIPGEGTMLLPEEWDVCDNCIFAAREIGTVLAFLTGYDMKQRRNELERRRNELEHEG